MKDKVKVGRLLLISHGAYSSYERVGWFMAVQDFSPSAMLKKYLDERPAETKQYGFKYEKFLVWLTTQSVLAEVEEFFDEWYLGDYMEAKEVSFVPRSTANPQGQSK